MSEKCGAASYLNGDPSAALRCHLAPGHSGAHEGTLDLALPVVPLPEVERLRTEHQRVVDALAEARLANEGFVSETRRAKEAAAQWAEQFGTTRDQFLAAQDALAQRDAECAALRDAMQEIRDTLHRKQGLYGDEMHPLIDVADRALSSSAGREMLERLEKADLRIRVLTNDVDALNRTCCERNEDLKKVEAESASLRERLERAEREWDELRAARDELRQSVAVSLEQMRIIGEEGRRTFAARIAMARSEAADLRARLEMAERLIASATDSRPDSACQPDEVEFRNEITALMVRLGWRDMEQCAAEVRRAVAEEREAIAREYEQRAEAIEANARDPHRPNIGCTVEECLEAARTERRIASANRARSSGTGE